MRVTAIVVARGGSERVPGKALRPFGDSTLIGHKVDQLRQCTSVDEVVVGSDSDEILNEAHRHGAECRKRDAYHCDESRCSANEMIRNMAAMVETDVVLWAHPTNPLCLPDIYDRAVQDYGRCHLHGYDSLCSVQRVQRHGWSDYKPGETVLFQKPHETGAPWYPLTFSLRASRLRHQLAHQTMPVYFQDGAIFIQRHADMLRNAYFYGKRPNLFEVEHPYGFDVDTERDMMVASAIYDAMLSEVTA